MINEAYKASKILKKKKNRVRNNKYVLFKSF